jgi:hypothetical protein
MLQAVVPAAEMVEHGVCTYPSFKMAPCRRV